MRTMSISLSEALYDKLKHSVPTKKISQFVSSAISKELEKQEYELTMAYEQIGQDKERHKLLKEWDAIDDFNENK